MVTIFSFDHKTGENQEFPTCGSEETEKEKTNFSPCHLPACE